MPPKNTSPSKAPETVAAPASTVPSVATTTTTTTTHQQQQQRTQHATAATAAATVGDRHEGGDVLGMLGLAVGIVAIYTSGMLLAVALQTSGLVEAYLQPFFTQLGLERGKIPFAVILAVILLNFVVGQLSNIGFAYLRSYNNANPRIAKEDPHKRKGLAGRLYAAHLNGIENIGIFAAAVIIAHIVKVPVSIRVQLSLLYFASRIVFVLLYAINVDILRSLFFAVGYSSIVLLFLHSLLSNPKDIDRVYHTVTGPLWQVAAPAVAFIESLM